MKREILYRGKRLDTKEWVYGYVLDDGIVGSQRAFVGRIVATDANGHTDDKFDIGTDFYEVDPDTVGQFTGMTDKNGVKIFEGDIVSSKMKYGESRGVIVFRNGRFAVDWRVRSEWTGKGISCRTDDLSSADEVVGTVFDNPEILEV